MIAELMDLPPRILGGLCVAAVITLAVVVLAMWALVINHAKRSITRERRRISLALSNVDRARGLDLEQTHYIVWGDRRDEATQTLRPHL